MGVSSPRETLGKQRTTIQNSGYSRNGGERVTRADRLKEQSVGRGVKIATRKGLSAMWVISN